MVSITARSETLDNTYLAELRLTRGNSQVRVDVRPSDGVIIAVMSDSPIVISNSLLTSADNLIEYD